MKRLPWLIFLALLSQVTRSSAYLVVAIDNIDDYVRLGQTIIIAECLPSDKDPNIARAFQRTVRVVDVLRGEAKKEQILDVIVGRSLIPARLYLIYSGGKPDPEGKLVALSYEPAVIEITLWGEVSKAEKQKRVNDFLEELSALSLKEQLLSILGQRAKQLKWEQRAIEDESKNLQGLLPK